MAEKRRADIKDFKSWFGGIKSVDVRTLERWKEKIGPWKEALSARELFPQNFAEYNPAQLRVLSNILRTSLDPGQKINTGLIKDSIKSNLSKLEAATKRGYSANWFRNLRYLTDSVSDFMKRNYIDPGFNEEIEDVKEVIGNLATKVRSVADLHYFTHVVERLKKDLGKDFGVNLGELADKGKFKEKLLNYTKNLDNVESALDFRSAVEHLQYEGLLTSPDEVGKLVDPINEGILGKITDAKTFEDLGEVANMMHHLGKALTCPVVDTGLSGKEVLVLDKLHLTKEEGLGAAPIRSVEFEGYEDSSIDIDHNNKILSFSLPDMDPALSEAIGKKPSVISSPPGDIKLSILHDDLPCSREDMPGKWKISEALPKKLSKILESMEKNLDPFTAHKKLDALLKKFVAMGGIDREHVPEGISRDLGEYIRECCKELEREGKPEQEILLSVDYLLYGKRKFITTRETEKDLFSYLKEPIERRLKEEMKPEEFGKFVRFLKRNVFSSIAQVYHSFPEILGLTGIEDLLRDRMREVSGQAAKLSGKKFTDSLLELTSIQRELRRMGVRDIELDPELVKKLENGIKSSGGLSGLKSLIHPKLFHPFSTDIKEKIAEKVSNLAGESLWEESNPKESFKRIRDLFEVVGSMEEADVATHPLIKTLRKDIQNAFGYMNGEKKHPHYIVDLFHMASRLGYKLPLDEKSPGPGDLKYMFSEKLAKGDAQKLIENMIKVRSYLTGLNLQRTNAIEGKLTHGELEDSKFNLTLAGIHSDLKSQDPEIQMRELLDSALKDRSTGYLKKIIDKLGDVSPFGFRIRREDDKSLTKLNKKIETEKEMGPLNVGAGESLISHPFYEWEVPSEERIETIVPKLHGKGHEHPELEGREPKPLAVPIGKTGDPQKPDGLIHIIPGYTASQLGTLHVEGGYIEGTRLVKDTPIGELSHLDVLSAYNHLKERAGQIYAEKVERESQEKG